MEEIKNKMKKTGKALFNPENKLSLIPNWLSFSRAIGGIAIPVMISTGASLPVLLGTTATIALTDFLDGKAARYLVKEETEEGALLDAISDKIFIAGLTVGILPKVPVFILNLILEGTISRINAETLSSGTTPKSTLLGKIKMWPLCIGLGLAYVGTSLGANTLLGFDANTIIKVAEYLSILSIPLEVANIKQYVSTYTEDEEEPIEYYDEDEEELEEDYEYEYEKELELIKENSNSTNKLILDKDKKIEAIVLENEQEKQKETGYSKSLTK